ncbi:alpha-L-fucosidase [Jiangella asiatica]|uniref:alpha-L-fucosidase n=1 Tax=Jiangella asiatica TaxID=2530372 RepID=A0A4R5CCU5_9ACTN|nr:alpha-L-fucosidase [Jiangella asiatica]TDD94952.1 alpha-L-fucosidase [Jiangella asiatica]
MHHRPVPDWYLDAKFGIFVHWGPYSVPAWAVPTGELGAVDPGLFMRSSPYAEWYANTVRIDGSPAAEHHRAVYGDLPYPRFLDAWRAERFEAADWARLFRAAGARYAVLTTKHHDGACLWDAPGTPEYNTARRGPRRDLVAEVAGAVRAEGLLFGAYYSGGLDWHVRDLPPLTHPDQLGAVGRPRDAGYARYAQAHVENLIARYRPDVLWNDIDWPDAGKDELPALFDRYYREVPEGVVNDRWGVEHCDFRTSEYQSGRANETTDRPWEHCRGIGLSFGYNAQEEARHGLTGVTAVRLLLDVVGRGGNLLLNVGPRADGTIPDLQRTTLEQLGRWLTANGEAVFGTRPVPAAGPLPAGCLGLVERDGARYAYLDGPAVVPLSPGDVAAGPGPSVTTVHDDAPVPARWTGRGLSIDAPRGVYPQAVRIHP